MMGSANAHEEIVHGIRIRDPFRWLEDRSLPETETWILDQQQRCDRYFESCSGLGKIEHRVRQYLDVEVIDQPACISERYFYRKRSIGQEQGCLYRRDIADGMERLLVDPSQQGPYVSVGIHRISADGNLLAYELGRGGEDRKEIRIVDADSLRYLPDSIPLGLGRGFAFSRGGYFYCHESERTADEHTICHHTLGSSSNDAIVFRRPRRQGTRLILLANEKWLGAIWLHPEGEDVYTDFWLAERDFRRLEWAEVFRDRNAPYSPILCHDRILAMVVTESNSSQLLVLSRTGKETGVFVPEKRAPIRQIAVTRERIFLSYLECCGTTLDSWGLSGEPARPLHVPASGTIRILPQHTQDSDSFFYSYESFDVPPAIYQHFSKTNTSQLWHQRGSIDRSARCRVQTVSFASRDGARIPLTLVSAEASQVDQKPVPVIMTGYGGFGVTVTPQFSVLATIMMELGAKFALAHIRGGGEFGKPWHDAGRGRNRQTAFDDFIAAGEWLCREGITTPRQMAIFGSSNSGLLVGAVMTQRPDLFRAVLCIAPLLDMLRYELFDDAVKYRSEYGTVEDPADFRALCAYSPYHQVSDDIDYPATLIVSGDKDDRCNPAHARKMAARLQTRSAQKASVVVDYSSQRGHSPVLPLSERTSALARRIAFLCHEIGIPLHLGGSDETPHC